LEKKDSDRRGFFSRIAKLGLAGGISALLLGRLTDKTIMPQVQGADGNPLIIGQSNSETHTTSLTIDHAGWSSFQAINNNTDATSAGLYGSSGIGVYALGLGPDGIGVQGLATATSGFTRGVYGRSDSSGGIGVFGGATATTGNTAGVYGVANSANGVGVMAFSGDPGGVPIIASGHSGQTGNLQEWRNNAGTALSAINKDGWLGLGTSSPARSIHLKGDQACFRMDRNVNSSAFILVRTSPDFSSVWKTFYVGVDASGVNNGEFFIGDVGTNVSGASTKRLWIDNSGGVHIPNLITGDITLANNFTVTEDEKTGLAFKNDAGEKIAVLDKDGNFHIKGKVLEDL